MSQKVTVLEQNYDTLTEAVAGALDGKEDLLLSLDATGKAVLYDGTSPATHVMVGRLQDGDGQVRARILGKNGTVRIKQNGAIVPGARVIAHAGTARVVTAAAGGRSLGFKLDRQGKGNGAAGDVIEVADVVEGQPLVPSADGLTALAFTAGGATGPEVAALRDAVKAILQAQKLMV
ncbi:MAG: hypothetical protein HZC55_04115 [Verrucomicrobia bacterium]|nr:hypothetical protein [Verrucomicrobiota bacterium]